MSKKKLPAILAGTSVVLGLLVFTAPVHAEREDAPLGDLVVRSSRVIIGIVKDVMPVPVPGGQRAEILVDEDLVGAGPADILLLGNMRDPSQPKFYADTRILAFLTLDPLGLPVPVDGDRGIIVLSDEALDVSRDVVLTAAAMGDQLLLADVQMNLRADGPVPPPALVALLAEELSLRVTADETQLLGEVACRPGIYIPQIRRWGVGHIADLGLTEGTRCLERIIRTEGDRSLRILAATALGDLGTPESIPTLLSLIPQVPYEPFVPDVDAPDDPPVGPLDDPEDETDPLPDLDEDDDTIFPQVPAEDPVNPTGDEPSDTSDDDDDLLGPDDPPQEPDGDEDPLPGDDPIFRRSDAGLAQAAVLALGKIGDPRPVRRIASLCREGDDLALHSTVVVALGLIGTQETYRPLNLIRLYHPNDYVRALAEQTLVRIRG